ncbi:hypothetical protein PJN21_29230, partial [Mycobacterium kansasii]
LLGYRAEIRDHRGAAVECTDKPLPTRDSARQWARAYQEDHPGAVDVRIDISRRPERGVDVHDGPTAKRRPVVVDGLSLGSR